MIEIRSLINFIGAALMLLYVGYCWVNQGCHHKGKGWRTREESPKGFWFTIVLWLVLSAVTIASSLILKR
ncbi:hypothetical protein OAO34_05805 [Candidatus Poseidoniaceae archaeon]|nr:hypothetical protein [Candidatus Poseidoniaceae archaeon]